MAKKVDPSDQEFQEFMKMANAYKGKTIHEIEDELYKLVNNFSESERESMIKKLEMLKQMDLLDNEQKRKIDHFIKILSN